MGGPVLAELIPARSTACAGKRLWALAGVLCLLLFAALAAVNKAREVTMGERFSGAFRRQPDATGGGCSRVAPTPRKLFVRSQQAMGTVFTIYLYASTEEQADTLFGSVFEEIDRVDRTLSNYNPDSELSRINRLAGRGPLTIDPEVFSLLQICLDYSKQSGGTFDITVGPLMRAWGFFRGQGRYPAPWELERARKKIGWENVQLDAASRTVHFKVSGMELDLGGIGKGYAVDRVVRILRAAGVKAAFVDAGSSTLYAMGGPPGKKGWLVRVPKPGERSQVISTVILRDESLSTSGSYEKFFKLNGRTYCHIMDPRTGAPVEGVLQTSVIARDGTTTEALSKPMFVMGVEVGEKYLAGIPGVSGLWVVGKIDSLSTVPWKWPGCMGDCGDALASAGKKNHNSNERN
jgi:thiamine biosynthesis lipoprotein